jgi:cupin 2 domain-containing protein
MPNFFNFPSSLPAEEFFETLVKTDKILIERIISQGQVTPEGQWYDQDRDEWVILLQGEAKIRFEDQSEIYLKTGDYLLILAHQRHQVTYTSVDHPCLWLAVHF